MGNGAYAFSRAVVESHCTKAYVKPRMATGGATGAAAAVARVTNWLITSRPGGLREMSTLVEWYVSAHTLQHRVWYRHLEQGLTSVVEIRGR